MSKKKPRITIKHKWVQGNQVVLQTLLRYGDKEKKVTMSFPQNVVDNPNQFRAMLEEAYEQNEPQTNVDLSKIPNSVE